MSKEEFIQLLKKKQGERSLREFATSLNISAAYLSDIYLGNRDPGRKIAKAVGFDYVRTTVVTSLYTRNRNAVTATK